MATTVNTANGGQKFAGRPTSGGVAVVKTRRLSGRDLAKTLVILELPSLPKTARGADLQPTRSVPSCRLRTTSLESPSVWDAFDHPKPWSLIRAMLLIGRQMLVGHP